MVAAQALDRAWARVADHGPSVAALTDEARHGLRKRLKSFRYMAEDFAALWPSPGLKSALENLRDLQEELGRLNDLRLARARGLTVQDADTDRALARSDLMWRSMLAQPAWWRPADIVGPGTTPP